MYQRITVVVIDYATFYWVPYVLPWIICVCVTLSYE